RGDRVGGAVAVGPCLAAVHRQEDAGGLADADADLATGVGAGLLLGVLFDLTEELEVVAGGQGNILAFDLATDDVEVAVRGGDGDVAPAFDVTAVGHVVVGVGMAVGGAGAQGDLDADAGAVGAGFGAVSGPRHGFPLVGYTADAVTDAMGRHPLHAAIRIVSLVTRLGGIQGLEAIGKTGVRSIIILFHSIYWPAQPDPLS